MSVKIHQINKHISIDIFEISSRTRAKQLPKFWEQSLVYILRKHTDLQQIQRIGYLPNKRGFHVKTKDNTYFIRVLFPTNIPLPYVVRRILGQDACCARAHTLNENIAEKATDRTSEHSYKYGRFYSMNILPCKQCFNKFTTEEYIEHVEENKFPEFREVIQAGLEHSFLYNLVLVWLMQDGNAEKVIDLDDKDLFDNYRINHVKSVNRFFTSIAQYCRAVITSISEVEQKSIVQSAAMELQIIMNSCLDICADINNRPLNSISLDECYGYSEFMVRYRQNAQNIAFALRYTGNECQILHLEEEVIF